MIQEPTIPHQSRRGGIGVNGVQEEEEKEEKEGKDCEILESKRGVLRIDPLKYDSK